MRYILLIILIVSLTVPIVEHSQSNNSSFKLQTQELDQKSHNEIQQIGGDENFQIEKIGVLNGSKDLSFDETFETPNIPKDGLVNLNFTEIQRDRLEFSSSFDEIWTQNHTGFTKSYEEENHTANLELNSGFGPENLNIDLNQEINNVFEFQISLVDLEFNVPSGESGYIYMIFEFDTILVRFVMFTTPDFEPIVYGSNPDDTVQDLNTSMLLLDIVDIVAEDDFPNELRKIIISSYMTVDYNYSLSFDRLSILEYQNTIDLIENGEIQTTEQYVSSSTQTGDSQYIELAPDFKAILEWELVFNEIKTMNFDLAFDAYNIIANTSVILDEPLEDFYIYYRTDTLFSSFNISNIDTEINSTGFWIRYVESETFSISGDLIREIQPVQTQGSSQGKEMNIITQQDSYLGVYLFHNKSGEVFSKSVDDENTGNLSILIPAFWDKGEIIGFLISSSGYYISWTTELYNSPSELISSSKYVITQAQQVRLPVTILNITSGLSQSAHRIETFINGSLRNIDTKYGIAIGAEEFDIGEIELFVNATIPGLVPVEFTLTLIITEVNIELSSSVIRKNSEEAIIDLDVIGLNNISVPAKMYLIGNGVNTSIQLSGQYTEIVVGNPAWDEDLAYSLSAKIELGNNISTHEFSLNIPILEDDSLGMAILSIMSITGVLGSVSYKMYQARFGDKTIDF